MAELGCKPKSILTSKPWPFPTNPMRTAAYRLRQNPNCHFGPKFFSILMGKTCFIDRARCWGQCAVVSIACPLAPVKVWPRSWLLGPVDRRRAPPPAHSLRATPAPSPRSDNDILNPYDFSSLPKPCSRCFLFEVNSESRPMKYVSAFHHDWWYSVLLMERNS